MHKKVCLYFDVDINNQIMNENFNFNKNFLFNSNLKPNWMKYYPRETRNNVKYFTSSTGEIFV